MRFGFEVKGAFNITDEMFDEMINLVTFENYSLEDAFDVITCEMDRSVDYIRDDVIKELDKRYKEYESEKKIELDSDMVQVVNELCNFVQETSKELNITEKEIFKLIRANWEAHPDHYAIGDNIRIKIK